MTAINKINRILLELLISVLFTLVTLQTAYAGGLEDDSNNTIIVTADGIAKVVDSNGKISLSPVDRNIEKGEIKFGVILTDASTFQINSVNRNQSHYRGGKVCVNDNMNTGSNAIQRNSLFERRLKKAVDKELTANGFQKQKAERPDFLIAYSIQVEDQVNVLSNGYGYGGFGHGYGHHGFGYRWSPRLWPPQIWLGIGILWWWQT